MSVISGITIRESQVKAWLRNNGVQDEYVLVSTKPESDYYQKLVSLPTKRALIVDLYTPILLEKELTFQIWHPRDWIIREHQRDVVRQFLKRGNHFLVANHRQREYWIEESQALGVPILKTNISVFPTGSGLCPSSFSLHPSAQRFVVLWFGGIYPWMNPDPLARAFGTLALAFPAWKVRMVGGLQPGTGYQGIYRKFVELAERTIPEHQIEFVPWQPEKNLSSCFQNAAFAVHLAKHTREDYYSHRVRLLTILNFGVGVMTSGSDGISDLLVKQQAGIKVDGDGLGLAEVLAKIIRSADVWRAWRSRARRVQREFVRQETDIRMHWG